MADVFWVLEIIMGPKAETYTFNQVKELLLNVFNSTVDRLDKKLDILKEKNSK